MSGVDASLDVATRCFQHLGGWKLVLNTANIVSGFTLLRPIYGRRAEMATMLRTMHAVALCAIRFGRKHQSISAVLGRDISSIDLVEWARRLLSERLQREYVKMWIDGRRDVFLDSWVIQSSLCELDSSRLPPFDLVIRIL